MNYSIYVTADKQISCVAKCLLVLPHASSFGGPRSSYKTPALKVLDCVLSLNRRYEEFVVPTINSFVAAHPHTSSLDDMQGILQEYGGVVQFFYSGLNYIDADRAKVFDGVLKYLVSIIPKYPGGTELDRLCSWATSTRPQDFVTMVKITDGRTTNVYGFGLAGWQYLRMLFGADTCKPDRMVTRFVAKCLGVSHISDGLALDIIEKAAPLAGMTVRNADRRIWENRKR